MYLGGSILVGLIFKYNNYKWPDDQEYTAIFPILKKIYINYDLQKKIIFRLLTHPWHFYKSLQFLSDILKRDFGIKETLQNLPDYPRWAINANCLQTGKAWRFSKARMGDYIAGYINNPEFSIADAIAISAGYPYFFKSYKLNVNSFHWSEFVDKTFLGDEIINCSPKIKHIQLQDDGIYENTGTEALFNPWPQKLRKEIDQIIVSDASAKMSVIDKYYPFFNLRQFDILSDQICNLRIEGTMSYLLQNKGRGIYLDFRQVHKSFAHEEMIQGEKIDNVVNDLINYKTDLHCVPEELFDNIIDFTEKLVNSLIDN